MRRVLAYASLAFVFLGTLAVLAIGAWLDDARVTRLVNEAARDAVPSRAVHVGRVHRDGWHRIVVSDVRVSAPNEPGHDAVSIKEAELIWHWTPLLRRQFVIEKLGIHDVKIDLVSDAPATPSDAPSTGYQKPHMPLRVILRDGGMGPIAVKAGATAHAIAVDGLRVSATADASEAALHGAIKLEHGGANVPASVVLTGDGQNRTAAMHTLSLTAVADSWLSGAIALEQSGQILLDGAQQAKPSTVSSAISAKMRFDAAQGELAMERGEIRLGEAVKAGVLVAIRDAWRAPVLQVDTLAVDVDLGALHPVIHPMIPGLRMDGQVQLSATPTVVALAAGPDAAPLALVGTLKQVSAGYAGNAMSCLSGTFLARYGDEAATLAAVMRLADVRTVAETRPKDAAAQASSANTTLTAGDIAEVENAAQAKDLAATLWAAVALPGGAVDANAAVSMDVQVSAPWAKTPSALGRDLGLETFVTGTLGWFQNVAAPPLRAYPLLRWGVVSMGGANIGPGSLDATAEIAQLAATQVRAQVAVRNQRIDVPPATEKRHRYDEAADGERDGGGADDEGDGAKRPQRWVLPQFTLQAAIERNGDDVAVQHASVTLGHASIKADVALQHITGAAPHIARFDVELPTTPLIDLVALMPPPGINTKTLDGTLQAKLTAGGDVPYEALAAQARLPRIDDALEPDDFEAWKAALHAYAAWARGWTRRFDTGFPFTLRANATLMDVNYSNAEASVTNLRLEAHCALEPHTLNVHATASVPEAPAPTPTPVRGVTGAFDARYERGLIQTHAHLALDSAALGNQPSPLEGIGFDLDARYAIDGDMHLDRVDIGVKNRGFSVHGEGLIEEPLDALATRAWLRPGFADTRASTNWRIDFSPPGGEFMSLTTSGPSVSGKVHFDAAVELGHGMLTGEGGLRLDDFSMTLPNASLSHATGSLPIKLSLRVGEGQDAVTVARNLSFGGGVLSVVSDADDIRNRPARPVYYDRLRPYRQGHGIRVAHAQSGPYGIKDIALEGRIENGMLLADWVGMNIFDGDVVGNFGLQLGRDSTLRGDVTLKASNVDVSNFSIWQLKQGPESEVSADARLSFLLGEGRRDLSANVNVTKIGPLPLDRFLRLLDPSDDNTNLQRAISNLWVIGSIHEIAMWIRFENLNMDIQYVPLLHIPYTDIGYRAIDRELVRRLSLTEFLDLYEPMAHAAVGPILGWNRAH